MRISLECSYCGHIWEETLYSRESLIDKTCMNGDCRHKPLIVKDLTSKIDYYEGSPPFPVQVDLNKLKEWL